MPVVLLITTPPTVTWSNATLGVVAMLMLLPVWLMAMLSPGLKLTVSPAVICSLVAPLLLASVQPFCNSVMSVLFWLMVVVLRQSIAVLAQGIAVLVQHIAQIGHDRVGGIQL